MSVNLKAFRQNVLPAFLFTLLLLAETNGRCVQLVFGGFKGELYSSNKGGYNYFNGPHLYADFEWISPSECIYGALSPANGRFSLVRRNIRTGKIKEFNGASNKIRNNSGMLTQVVPSHNGEWFAWTEDGHYLVCRSDGTGCKMMFNSIVGIGEDRSKPFWLPDHKHWLAALLTKDKINGTSLLTVGLMDSNVPSNTKSIQVVVNIKFSTFYDLMICNGRDGRVEVLVIGKDGTFEEVGPVSIIAQLKIRPDGSLMRIRTPAKATNNPAQDVDVDYCCERFGKFAWVKWPSGVSEHGGSSSSNRGRSNRIPDLVFKIVQLGSMKILRSGKLRSIAENVIPGNLAWLPDGKHLSYVYQDKIVIMEI